MNRMKVLNDTKWLLYCCCEGCGLGPFSDPLIAAEAKQLCCRSSLSTTDIYSEDGLCKDVAVCLCITQQCNLPPVEDAPTCACFNKKCGGSMGRTGWKSELFQESKIMDDTFWIYYFLCLGCGLNKCDQGLYSSEFKELCCRGFTNLEPPIVEGVCCSQVSTQCCMWGECQMPPAKPNPTVAICCWRLNKEKYTGPTQVVMM